MSNAAAYAELLRAGRWFGGLDSELRTALLGAASVATYAKDEAVFLRGDPPRGMYALVDGSVRVVGATPGGTEVLLFLLESPMWFGENSILDEQPRSQDAIANEPSTVVHVGQAAALALAQRAPLFWRDLGVLVTARLRLVFSAMEEVGQPVSVRLARKLVLSAERYGDWEDRSSRQVSLRQDQLATMLASSRQTVNQHLKRLAADGIVRIAYGRVEILDLEKLRAAARPVG